MCFPHHLLITFRIAVCMASSHLCLKCDHLFISPGEEGQQRERALMRPTGPMLPHTRQASSTVDLTHMRTLLISAQQGLGWRWGICPDLRKQDASASAPILKSSPITGDSCSDVDLALLPHHACFQLSNTGLCLWSCASLVTLFGGNRILTWGQASGAWAPHARSWAACCTSLCSRVSQLCVKVAAFHKLLRGQEQVTTEIAWFISSLVISLRKD